MCLGVFAFGAYACGMIITVLQLLRYSDTDMGYRQLLRYSDTEMGYRSVIEMQRYSDTDMRYR